MIRMSGGKVVLRCGSRTIVGKQVLHLKEVSVSKFQRNFDIFAHYIGFQEGISIRQKELV